MHDCAEVFQRVLGRNDSELSFYSCRFNESLLERFGPPRTVLRMNALAKLFERGNSLFRIETVQTGVFIGGVGYLSGGVQSSSSCMGQSLRLGQVGFASPQFGCPLRYLRLQLVSGLAKLFFGPRPLVDEACALKCCRSVITSKAQQKLVNLRGKVDATTGRGNHTALGIDTDRNDNTVTRLDVAADIGNDFHSREPAALGEMTFQPFRKRLPCLPRVTSTTPAILGTHKRTKTKSSRSKPISASAKPAATAAGSIPTHAVGMVESATRSLSTVRSARISASVSMDIQCAVVALLRADRRSRISSSNWSGETKNGFS